MKLTLTKSTDKATNIIFLADSIKDLRDKLTIDNFNYFKKYWKDEDMQYVKGTNAYVFVVKTTTIERY